MAQRFTNPGWRVMSACRKLAAAALRNAFEPGRVDPIRSIARPANTVSIQSMERLGLKLECVFESNGVSLMGYVTDRSSRGQKVIAGKPALTTGWTCEIPAKKGLLSWYILSMLLAGRKQNAFPQGNFCPGLSLSVFVDRAGQRGRQPRHAVVL